MSSFKIKNKKKIVSSQRITLDAEHNEKLKQFNIDNNELKNIKDKLTNYQKDYTQLCKKKDAN